MTPPSDWAAPGWPGSFLFPLHLALGGNPISALFSSPCSQPGIGITQQSLHPRHGPSFPVMGAARSAYYCCFPGAVTLLRMLND